jgi:low affinity Fe/Cu permease
MTLVIQRAEHRDTQAINAKLDEILHALGDARKKSRGWMKRNQKRLSDTGNTCVKTTRISGNA